MILVCMAAACSTDPGATSLPAGPDSAPVSRPRSDQPDEFAALELRGVKGGRLSWTVPGTPAEVAAMLLDFDQAAGHRAWARHYRVVKREADRVVAQWKFKGKLGINPTVVLEFLRVRDGRDVTLRYRITKPDFGLAAFFGDYRLTQVSRNPPQTRLTERVFIDSGIWLARASPEDIKKGLHADARLIRAWMEKRTAKQR